MSGSNVVGWLTVVIIVLLAPALILFVLLPLRMMEGVIDG